MMDSWTMGHVFSKYFNFPCQFTLHQLLHIYDLSAIDISSLSADSIVKEQQVILFFDEFYHLCSSRSILFVISN
jgi:hypothetical protein